MKKCTKCHKDFDPGKEGVAFEFTDKKHERQRHWFCDKCFSEWDDFVQAYFMTGGQDDR